MRDRTKANAAAAAATNSGAPSAMGHAGGNSPANTAAASPTSTAAAAAPSAAWQPSHAVSLLRELNERQREAVVATEGPLLVLAGAGTGKTRVITYRVAHLLELGVPPNAVLAVTFTNKAADVMKQRIAGLLGGAAAAAGDSTELQIPRFARNDKRTVSGSGEAGLIRGSAATDKQDVAPASPRVNTLSSAQVWVSTFHSFCARLLRREAAHLGLPRDFAIYDDDDQLMAVKRAVAGLDLPAEDYAPRALRAQISHAKNHGITPEEMESGALASGERHRHAVARVFRAYGAGLRAASALDFDDLLLRAVELLRENPRVREAWQARLRYILVDEFQDTNRWQEELVRLLAGPARNVCVVGDEDQSIYGWRGARAGNLNRFLDDFPGARIVRLEENYRSTQTILDAAAAVVERNSNRLGKTLRATRDAGESIRFYEAPDAFAEAEYICGEIARLLSARGKRAGDRGAGRSIAVLYRTAAQSRPFEEILRQMNIRHRVVGGFRFYARAEVRAALAYLRLLFHPEDNVALLRVLNAPPRGIGATSVAWLEQRARETHRPLWDVIRECEREAPKRLAAPLAQFRELIESLQRDAGKLPAAAMIEQVLGRTGYLAWIEQQDALEHASRSENLRELSNAMAEATQRGESLEEMLDRAALASDADEYDAAVSVSLMTLHSAKGLEFDAVFLAGLEDGLLPHSRSLAETSGIEEERRLFYVGMTRAKRVLTVTRAASRRGYGSGEAGFQASKPSRFLREIPGELIAAAFGSRAEPGESRRYEADAEFAPEFSERSGRPRGRSYAGSRRSCPVGENAVSRGVPVRVAGSTRAGRPSRPARSQSQRDADSGEGGGSRGQNSLIGLRVRHSKYGLGTIIGVEGVGDERRLTISFQDYGAKKIVERYANLQIA